MTSIVTPDVGSPLALVERAVQDHAKAIALDSNYPTAHHWYAVNVLIPTQAMLNTAIFSSP